MKYRIQTLKNNSTQVVEEKTGKVICVGPHEFAKAVAERFERRIEPIRYALRTIASGPRKDWYAVIECGSKRIKLGKDSILYQSKHFARANGIYERFCQGVL